MLNPSSAFDAPLTSREDAIRLLGVSYSHAGRPDEPIVELLGDTLDTILGSTSWFLSEQEAIDHVKGAAHRDAQVQLTMIDGQLSSSSPIRLWIARNWQAQRERDVGPLATQAILDDRRKEYASIVENGYRPTVKRLPARLRLPAVLNVGAPVWIVDASRFPHQPAVIVEDRIAFRTVRADLDHPAFHAVLRYRLAMTGGEFACDYASPDPLRLESASSLFHGRLSREEAEADLRGFEESIRGALEQDQHGSVIPFPSARRGSLIPHDAAERGLDIDFGASTAQDLDPALPEAAAPEIIEVVSPPPAPEPSRIEAGAVVENVPAAPAAAHAVDLPREMPTELFASSQTLVEVLDPPLAIEPPVKTPRPPTPTCGAAEASDVSDVNDNAADATLSDPFDPLPADRSLTVVIHPKRRGLLARLRALLGRLRRRPATRPRHEPPLLVEEGAFDVPQEPMDAHPVDLQEDVAPAPARALSLLEAFAEGGYTIRRPGTIPAETSLGRLVQQKLAASS